MNYIRIDKDNLLNGDGVRVVLWTVGCNHLCENCHNPETHNPNNGVLFNEIAKQEIFNELEKDYTAGLTLSGGDPLFPASRDTITQLCKEVKEKFPNKNIWCWTGFTYEQIKDLEIMNYIDVLVDGRFVQELKDTALKWRGSSNQRVIDIKETRKKGEIVLYCD